MESKPIWKSKTVWGGNLQMLAVFVSQHEKLQEYPALAGLVAVVGFAITIWGRFTATKKVTIVPAKKKTSKLPLILVSLTALSLTGCATTSQGRYSQAQEVFISTVTILNDARAFRKIDDDTWNDTVLPLIQEGDLLLDQIKLFIDQGGDIDIQTLMANLRSVLRALLLHQADIQERNINNEPATNLSVDFRHARSDGSIGPCRQKDRGQHVGRFRRQARRAA